MASAGDNEVFTWPGRCVELLLTYLKELGG